MAEAINAEQVAEQAIEAMMEAKANEIVRIDLLGKSSVTDYFVICTLNTPTHLRNAREKIADKVEEAGGTMLRKEGTDASGWVLLDCGDVVIHLMLRNEREYYNLERTWGDAPLMRFEG